MKYKRYSWVGNRIEEEEMKQLYQNKLITKKPITVQVSEAIKDYLNKLKNNIKQEK